MKKKKDIKVMEFTFHYELIITTCSCCGRTVETEFTFHYELIITLEAMAEYYSINYLHFTMN